MPYTSHGHWHGPGEPTLPAPEYKARCGGPVMCRVCMQEADPVPTPPPGTPRQDYTLKVKNLTAGEAAMVLRLLHASGFVAEYVPAR